MTALERVMQLKGEGRAEGEIIAALRAEGISPMQISDAINQSQIKEGLMVYDPRYNNATPYGVATPNRKGFKIDLSYEDLDYRWLVKVNSELLSDILGEGTSELKKYNTTSLFAEFRFDKSASNFLAKR